MLILSHTQAILAHSTYMSYVKVCEAMPLLYCTASAAMLRRALANCDLVAKSIGITRTQLIDFAKYRPDRM